jgi:hypothetical protein
MRAQEMSVGTSEKRVWYSARRLSFSVDLKGLVGEMEMDLSSGEWHGRQTYEFERT